MIKEIKRKMESRPREYWESVIDRWIFSEVDRKMLKRKLLDDITFFEIAEEFDISETKCTRRIYKALEQFEAHMDSIIEPILQAEIAELKKEMFDIKNIISLFRK